MNLAIVYHFPFDLENQYLSYASRFDETYNRFKPKIPHEVFLGVGNEIADTHYDPIPQTKWTYAIRYNGDGCDIGMYQSACLGLTGHDFVLFCGATTYFKREGWLERLIEAREKHGEGLYAISGSFEASPLGTNPAPNPHIRTSCFACHPKALLLYPKPISSREDCYRFENGEWKVSRYFGNTKIVYWDSCVDINECRNPANIFRRGDQSNLLIWDKRCDEYQQANPAEKKRLERLADGDIAKFPI